MEHVDLSLTPEEAASGLINNFHSYYYELAVGKETAELHARVHAGKAVKLLYTMAYELENEEVKHFWGKVMRILRKGIKK
ncbi:hypothetical protein HX021_08270 [Sphingobacterium sp. N143]|uniref:hypothetical protein n=1 Tax=Sphingobacterium sp. N143 TaxID=2746727 RepID=UPI0025781C24|nr:hypothetical protein [Sphingobacterium sp. N143]MDM1294292.1 hypothetical protein [Sphingobacterium sp. N143]